MHNDPNQVVKHARLVVDCHTANQLETLGLCYTTAINQAVDFLWQLQQEEMVHDETRLVFPSGKRGGTEVSFLKIPSTLPRDEGSRLLGVYLTRRTDELLPQIGLQAGNPQLSRPAILCYALWIYTMCREHNGKVFFGKHAKGWRRLFKKTRTTWISLAVKAS